MFNDGDSAVNVAVSLGQANGIAPVSPTLDDKFWSTNNGNIYAIGTPDNGGNTYLIRVPYNGTSLGSPAGFAQLRRSTGANTASVPTTPVAEFLTASSATNPDFIFVGGAGTNYRFMNRISTLFNGSNNSPTSMANWFAIPGGSISGIVIDTRTTDTTGQATANIYFGTIGIASTTQSTIVQLAQAF
jgi:hypothetical protein